ncbi:hypothetical protein CTEN210_13569 [Chaetoceros tenuissimus]|uniref:G-protein coupled receptors family 1 profile domain-containing protein n=1 Tax=Chaetoceros tenuissimus TaxID=426638 RepID=A0AAD3HBJ6_9STRA|nr:hypothetical protein CTEN210_13569 [Chaetoceros tenuissimus]
MIAGAAKHHRGSCLLFFALVGPIFLSALADSSFSASELDRQHKYSNQDFNGDSAFYAGSDLLEEESRHDENDILDATSFSSDSTEISFGNRQMNEETEDHQDNSTTTHDLEFYDPHNKFDRYRLEKALNDPRSQYEYVYTSSNGHAVATATGTISAISSLTIIYIILNSLQGLKTVYHRIMFGLCCHDIFLSLAIAFTTLPMPKNMIYQQFEGLVLGNQTTCNIQGFFFTLGANSTLQYTLFLFIYYLLSIRYKMTNEQLSKRIEPIMHFFCNAYGLMLAITFLVTEAYNPTPMDVFCTSTFLPYWCPTEPEGDAFDECVLRINPIVYPIRWVLIIASVIFSLVTLVSLFLIVHAIYKQEKMLKAYVTQNKMNANKNGNDKRVGIIKDDFRFTRKIAKEALMYLLAFIAVNIFSALTLYNGKYEMGIYGKRIVAYFHLALRPLQGFFNLCIFVYHKYEHLKRRDDSITFKQGLVEIFRRKNKDKQVEGVDDFIVSSLSIVKHDIEKRERAGNAVDQQILVSIEEHSKLDASTQINMIENKQDQEEEEQQEEEVGAEGYGFYGQAYQIIQTRRRKANANIQTNPTGGGYEKYAIYGEAFRTALNDSDSKTSSNNISSSNQESSSKSRNTQSLALEEFVEDGISFSSPHTNRDDVSFGQDSRFFFGTFVRSLKSNQSTKSTDNKSNDDT